MPKYRVFVHGMNFRLRLSDAEHAERLGFYVTSFVEADSPDAAESAVIDLLRHQPKLRGTVLNAPDDPPRMSAEEVEEIADWPADTARPLTGLALYREDEQDGE